MNKIPTYLADILCWTKYDGYDCIITYNLKIFEKDFLV